MGPSLKIGLKQAEKGLTASSLPKHGYTFVSNLPNSYRISICKCMSWKCIHRTRCDRAIVVLDEPVTSADECSSPKTRPIVTSCRLTKSTAPETYHSNSDNISEMQSRQAQERMHQMTLQN